MNDYSSQQVRQHLDETSALELLTEMKVENPSESLQCYIRSVPKLLKWYEREGREFSWRDTEDEWEILLAEILLQRTKADAVSEVYPDFVENYPNPSSLHAAGEKEIQDHIRTLGFVNQRLKTLKSVSELLVKEYDNQLPENLDELKQCWRIGNYVVGAVAIFARNEPQALVDSNIARVIGGIFDLDLASQPHKDQQFFKLMDALTPKDPEITRDYYFALIDLGSLVHTPNNPTIEDSPFRDCY